MGALSPTCHEDGSTEKNPSSPTALSGVAGDKPGQLPDGFYEMDIGVWHVIRPKASPLLPSITRTELAEQIRGLKPMFRSLWWFFREIYQLSPVMCLLWMFAEVSEALMPAISTYTSNILLALIEQGVKEQSMNTHEITKFFTLRVCLVVMEGLVYWISQQASFHLENKAKLRFRLLNIEVRLADDKKRNKDSKMKPVPELKPWATMNELRRMANHIITLASSMILMYSLLSGTTGYLLATLMVTLPILRATPLLEAEAPRFYRQEAVYYGVNKDFMHMETMIGLSKNDASQDVLNLGLSHYIMSSFRETCQNLATINISHPGNYLWRQAGISIDWAVWRVVDDIPLMYYVLAALRGWQNMPFATISSVQSVSSTLQWRFSAIMNREENSSQQILSRVHDFHTALQREKLIEGIVTYPPSGGPANTGAGIELRNLTFSYPTDTTTKPALQDCSFTILPGQLVVIVGGNGSGKSSLIKLLTRQYDPTAGELLIDGRPVHEYKLSDLREAIAVLAQDHELFEGLTICENVGLGRWQHMADHDLVQKALELGGAESVVHKFKDGANTVLMPTATKNCLNVITREDAKLKTLYEELEKNSDVSGGEKQRLIAARTFMRMNTGNTKLVLVDEPSSAMDPKAEYELFRNLREARAGKTMICVTHRFGHLTKHADLILCLKDGHLVEQGTHTELMKKNGEYKEMYNLQAHGFTDEPQVNGQSSAVPELSVPTI